MEIKENRLYLLYRRGESKHIQSLYEKGEIYINTIDFIRECDENQERSDLDDGIKKRTFLRNAKFTFCDVGLDIEKEGKTFNDVNCAIKIDSNQKGNIYCFSGIYTKHITGERNNIEFDTKSFGESLIVIHNPKEFLERVIKGLKENGFKDIQYKPIEYYQNDYSGNVGFFKKHEFYSPQNEFRIFIPNEKNERITFSIGSIQDISSIENNNLIKVTFSDSKEQIIKIV